MQKEQTGIDDRQFTAFKVYPHDQSRDSYVRNLTLSQARDEKLFPLGPQYDISGRLFVWSYGIDDGRPV